MIFYIVLAFVLGFVLSTKIWSNMVGRCPWNCEHQELHDLKKEMKKL